MVHNHKRVEIFTVVRQTGTDDCATERTLGVDRNTRMQPSQTRRTEDVFTRMTRVGRIVDVQADGASVAIEISSTGRH